MGSFFLAFRLGVPLIQAWKYESRHDTSAIAASHVYHVICFSVSAVCHAFPVSQHIVQLLVFPSR